MVVSYGSRLREPCSRQEDVIGLAGVVSMFRMTGSVGHVGGTRLCDSSKSTPFLKNCYNDNDLTLRWHRGLEKDSAGAVGAQVCPRRRPAAEWGPRGSSRTVPPCALRRRGRAERCFPAGRWAAPLRANPPPIRDKHTSGLLSPGFSEGQSHRSASSGHLVLVRVLGF